MSFHQHTLANGLTIIGEISPSARSVAAGFFVRRERAMRRRRNRACRISSSTWSSRARRAAPPSKSTATSTDRRHYNAFTSEENTVFYAAILPEYLPEAVDILADILRPSLRAEDFEMEKKVIIEEIGMYDDQPMWSPTTSQKSVLRTTIRSATASSARADSVGGPETRADAGLLSTAVTSRRTSPCPWRGISPGPMPSASSKRSAGTGRPAMPRASTSALPGTRPCASDDEGEAEPGAGLHALARTRRIVARPTPPTFSP